MEKKTLAIIVTVVLLGTLYFQFYNQESNSAVTSNLMLDMPCHAMGGQVMGNCTEKQILELQNEIVVEPKSPLELFTPGSGISLSKLSPAQPSTVLAVRDRERIRLESQIVSRSKKNPCGSPSSVYAKSNRTVSVVRSPVVLLIVKTFPPSRVLVQALVNPAKLIPLFSSGAVMSSYTSVVTLIDTGYSSESVEQILAW